MLEEDEVPEPKPLVEYGYLPEDTEPVKPDLLDKYEDYNSKISLDKLNDFGGKKKIMNDHIRNEIHDYHKVKAPEHIFIPYDIDMEEQNLIGPAIPKDFNYHEIKKKDADEISDDEGEVEEEPMDKRIPITHSVELLHTNNTCITTLDIDRAGNRLVTGNYDGTIKIWDFNNMTRRPSAFHTVEAADGFPVLSVSWAPSGGFFLTATGDCQAKVFDRDGNFEIGCLKGDSYLHDISHTKGHTYPLTDGKWHPAERNIFITSARDSTIRLWDIYSKPMGIDQELMQNTILRAKTNKNHKIPINSCNWSPDGNIIVGGVNDGSLQFWHLKSGYWKPDIYNPNAHASGSEITSVIFSEDNLKVFSRAEDSTMKMWDLRRWNRPVKEWTNLPCFASRTGMALSPDESMIMTGTSVKKGHENSSLVFFDTYSYEKVKEIKVCRSSIVSMTWNGKLNQIAVGAADGICRMYFSPEYSTNGIVNSIYKKAKTKEVDDFNYAQPIITPLVLPLFDELNFDRSTLLEKLQGEEGPSYKTDLPEQGPGSKYSRPPSVTQYIMQNVHKTLYKEGDARETLLKFRPKDTPGEWVDSAYKKTQPKPVFDYTGPLEDEAIYYEEKKGKKCPGCGLKFCTCKKTIFQLPIPKITAPKHKNF